MSSIPCHHLSLQMLKGVMVEDINDITQKYAEEVRKIANECIGLNANPQMLCFFVNAKDDLK